MGDALVAAKIMVRRMSGTPGSALEAVVPPTMVQGTIGEFGSERIILDTTSSGTSASYTCGKATTYVDEDGNSVSLKTVKSGLPVTIYYTKSGETLIANKVVVRKVLVAPDSIIERKTTTTTTTEGN